MSQILFQNSSIEYYVKGEGKPIVLLHGYLESLLVWEQFAKELSKNYKIISIDLPGHGKSSIIEDLTIEKMAEAVKAVLDNLGISKCAMIGHSMGGYVTLDFYSRFPENLESYCLFHSTPFADDQQRKDYREHLITLIESGKHILLAKEHVEKTFAELNIETFAKQIGFLKIIAINTQPKAAVLALRAMKNRKDYTQLFEKTDIKALWILGSNDNFISTQVTQKFALSENIIVEIIDNVGHQGYIENISKSLDIVRKFIENKIK